MDHKNRSILGPRVLFRRGTSHLFSSGIDAVQRPLDLAGEGSERVRIKIIGHKADRTQLRLEYGCDHAFF